MSASPRLQRTEAHWWGELFSSFSSVRAHCMPVWGTLIQSLDQANPWNQQLVAHFGERTARWECNKGFSLPSAPGDHHSGRVIVGTQSLTFLLSSQNKFSFSRAGSFQPSSFGFCKKEKSCTLWVLPASWGHHNIYRSISLGLEALPDSFCSDRQDRKQRCCACGQWRKSSYEKFCLLLLLLLLSWLAACQALCLCPAEDSTTRSGAGAAPAGSGSTGAGCRPPGTPTVMRMQCRSRGSPESSLGPTMAASLATSFTRTMSMSFSQQKAWIRVKWICKAMSPSSSWSAASTQNATLSGSLQEGSSLMNLAVGAGHPAAPPGWLTHLLRPHHRTYTFISLADS